MQYRPSTVRSFAIFLMVAAAASISACGGGDSENATPAAEQGAEGGPCYGNGTCNGSLSCLSSICVNAGSGGAGGSGGTAGTGGGAGTGCRSLSIHEECVNGMRVAKLVQIPAKYAPSYAIDSTEVTWGQYKDWLDAGQAPAQNPECSWNTSFKPDCTFPATEPDFPVVCVDWCDAYAYCKAVGKRLCGKIGGGPNGFGDSFDALNDQWDNACTSATAHCYPYGGSNLMGQTDGYELKACNGYHAQENATTAVGSYSTCQSSVAGYSGVYDLSGNAAEWQDVCQFPDDGPDDRCNLRGGSFDDTQLRLSCRGIDDTKVRNHASVFVGFRCCSEP